MQSIAESVTPAQASPQESRHQICISLRHSLPALSAAVAREEGAPSSAASSEAATNSGLKVLQWPHLRGCVCLACLVCVCVCFGGVGGSTAAVEGEAAGRDVLS